MRIHQKQQMNTSACIKALERANETALLQQEQAVVAAKLEEQLLLRLRARLREEVSRYVYVCLATAYTHT